MLRDGAFVKLIPFESSVGPLVSTWYYANRYRAFFRNFPEPFTSEDFKRFDKIIGGQVYLIQHLETKAPVGLITIYHVKTLPRIGTVGIMIDEAYQRQTWCIESLIIIGDYYYNAKGFTKMAVEFMVTDQHIKRITEKGGLIFEGTLFKEAYLDGAFHDELRYSMSADTFRELYGEYFKNISS